MGDGFVVERLEEGIFAVRGKRIERLAHQTDFEVEVLRLCPEAIETFMRIERPGEKGADRDHVARHRSPRALVPHFRHHAGHDLHFFSIGEFYAEIERGLKALEQALAATGETLFTGDPARQARPGDYFQDTGPLGTVTDLESALLAIDFITEQGEGLGDRIYGEFGELGHTLSKPKVDDIAMMVPHAVNWQIKETLGSSLKSPPADFKKLARIIHDGGYRGFVPIETLAMGRKDYDPAAEVVKVLLAMREAIGAVR